MVRRYVERDAHAHAQRYSLLNAAAWAIHQERLGALARLLPRMGWPDLALARVVEAGSGSGGALLDLIRLGAQPAQLVGIELVPKRAALARQRLPAATTVIEGDACDVDIVPASVDIAMQFTVFSSLLDDAYQRRLATAMWQWLKPGGAVLWYDFTVNNPANPDVRGVPLARLRVLFPQAEVRTVQRLTLAPPLARAACALSPALYGWFNALPWLRTHRMAWLAKPR